jgi:tRNA threonylcarbamoyl adenosine modification protein YeaZ
MTGARQVGRDEGTILAIDTATSRVAVAIGNPDGTRIAEVMWPAGHRHGETLLPAIEGLLVEAGLARADLGGIVVGTGPGTFTGLRVGLATAKALAHGLGIPIAGVSTGAALLEAATEAHGTSSQRLALAVPAGPQDRVVVDGAAPRLVPAGTDPDLGGATLVAVDLEGRAPTDAVDRGAVALAGLGRALLRIGAARLAGGDADDLAGLVPEYVTLPRGVARAMGEVTWSRDRR